MKKTKNHVLLTGATGFVGKVVLEELTRRRKELGIEKIYVMVRPRKDKGADHRFQKSIVESACFSKRTDDWTSMCVPVSCELTLADCGMSPADLAMVTSSVTHVIHCAASVDFDLPIADAASANITAALEVLSVAQRCTRLVNMVSVSTAYVSTHISDTTPIREELQPLPRPAADIYREILAGTIDEKALLRATGHANTYTVTKCMAEHLLIERRGNVPLSIVRPSIIAACLETPFPGWIDSLAGFAGFLALCGTGHLRTLAANPGNRPDIVPCDHVSRRVIDGAFAGRPPKTSIRYAVATQKNAQTIQDYCDQIVAWFRRHPVDRIPAMNHVAPRGDVRLVLEEFRHHKLPTRLARMWFRAIGEKTAERVVAALGERLDFLNSAFSYFAHNTFDFRPRRRRGEPELEFDAAEYCELVCRGVYQHILRRHESSVPIGGRALRESTNDILWSLQQPAGNGTIRALAVALKKTLRNSTSEVTFDRDSFRAAMASAPEGTRFVLLPTHRSYADFLLISYLAFARPELGLELPRIAAAEEFSRIPILGKVFRKGGAFYLKRGMGKADPELTATVNALVAEGRTLEFYIEGARSRSRQFLAPKHGLLRCLQGTGERFALLPVAITYDRIPEESSLLRELKGAPKPPMRLRSLFAGARRLVKGELAYGRIHLRCGEPVLLSPGSDVREVGRTVMAELQANTSVTTYHLRSFLHRNPIPGVSLEWLRREIESRGGHVLDSPLRGEQSVDPASERCMRYHWIHHFYADARALWPNHPVLEDHVRRNAYVEGRPASQAELADPRLRGLLRALFEPVVGDYASVARSLGSPDWAPRHASPRGVLYENPFAHLPNVQAAFADLVDREILALDESGAHRWGPNADEIAEYRKACVLPELGSAMPVVLRAVPREAIERREVGT